MPAVFTALISFIGRNNYMKNTALYLNTFIQTMTQILSIALKALLEN